MSRVGLVVAATAVVMGVALAGCSAMPDWMTPSMPDWLSSKPSTPATQTLRFESNPPGADVRTMQGQTCLTPCGIEVPSQTQAVSITKIGYIPQTIQITAGPPPDHNFWESAPPPTMTPNPVVTMLQPVPPPPGPVHKPRPRPHRPLARAAAPAAGSEPPPPGEPAPAGPAGSPFPPPPATQ
jgi:hypothetical protein